MKEAGAAESFPYRSGDNKEFRICLHEVVLCILMNWHLLSPVAGEKKL